MSSFVIYELQPCLPYVHCESCYKIKCNTTQREVNYLHTIVDAVSQSLSHVRLALPKAIFISVSSPAKYAARSDFGEFEGNLPGAGESYYHRKLVPVFFKAT